MRRNSIQEISYSRQLYIESWQQVVEVLMGVVNEEAEKETLRIDMLFELIQDLLLKVEREREGREGGREGETKDYNRGKEREGGLTHDVYVIWYYWDSH